MAKRRPRTPPPARPVGEDELLPIRTQDAITALGDEAIAEAVQRELREDAATTELRVDVRVRRGVARLRGVVPELLDAENAEEVASRVPGVREVVEELEVAAQRE